MNLLLLRRRAIYRRLLVKKKKNSSSSAGPSEREGKYEATATTKQTTVATTAPATAPEAEWGRQEGGEGAVAAAAAAAAGEEEDDDVVEEVYEAVLDAEASKHCCDVLRIRVGDSLRVGVFNAGICEAKVSEILANKVKIHLPRDIRLESPPGDVPLVDLLVALPRPKTLNKILQVAATLGVGKLLVVCARRSERAYLDSPKLSFQNISKQLKIGLEQGVATRLPEVHVFASWVGLLTFLQPRHSLCPLHAAAAAAKSSISGGSKAVHQQAENEEEREGHKKKEETPEMQRQQSQEQHQQMQDDRQQLVQKREQRPQRQEHRQTQHEQHREKGQEEQQTQEKNKQQKTQEQQQVEPSSAELPWCCFSSRVGRSRRLLAHPDASHSLAALQANLLLTDPTLRNGLPSPSVEGSFSACLAPQSAAEPAGNSHNSTSCSSSCSSSNSGSTDEGTEATPAHRAAGRTVRNTSSGSAGCEDSSSTIRTVTPRRVPPAAGYKMDEGAFSNSSGKDDSLNREDINDHSCTRGSANRIESYYKGKLDESSRKRHDITDTGVCPERLEEGRGHAVAYEEQAEAEQDTGKANEDEGGCDEEDRQDGEASAMVRPVPAGGAAAIAAAAAGRQNDSQPAGVPVAGAREEAGGGEIILEKRELNTEQGFHRGRRLVYKDEDGFYIVLPERRHTKTDEHTPA